MFQKLKQLLRHLNASHFLAVIFLAYIFYVGIAGLPQCLDTTFSFLNREYTMQQFIRTIDDQYSGMLSSSKEVPFLQNKGTYINLNGYLANAMDQRLMNERVKLNNGHMAELMEESPSIEQMVQIADNIASVYEHQKENGKHFLFVMAPSQISKYEDVLPVGYTDTTNDTADLLLSLLSERGISCLDLRETFAEEGMTADNAFFTTDHHWTPQTGFWAYVRVLEKLEDMEVFSSIDHSYTGEENFEFRIYEDCFLGSSGKRTGLYYAGVDDFCVITPKFDTHITVKYENDNNLYEGTYANTVNEPISESDFNRKDYFNFHAYIMYGHSDSVPVLRTNEAAPEQTKLMLIGDSFNNVPFSLMSLYASSCYELDMRNFEGNFAESYESYDPDTVIFLINPRGCVDTNTSYPFFEYTQEN